MKVSTKVNLSEFFLLLAVLFLGAVYLWYTLPTMGDQIRLMIVVISIVLILILGNSLKHELQL
jgi:hypothetical protein